MKQEGIIFHLYCNYGVKGWDGELIAVKQLPTEPKTTEEIGVPCLYLSAYEIVEINPLEIGVAGSVKGGGFKG